jgi:adenosylcobinamide-GDP ribazoletransferase
MIKQLLLAFQFLTRIRFKDIPESPGRSMAYFPVVGLILGVGLVFLDLVLPQILPGMITDILLVIYLIWITGALHLDGFCDVADGFYAGRSTDEILTIMRDSRIGTMAAVCLFSLLTLKIFSIAHLPRPVRYPVLLLMPVWSRWAMVWAASLSSYARSGEGLGSEFCDYTGKDTLLKGSWLPVLSVFYFFELRGALFLIGFFLLGIYWLIKWINGKIGGMTGDTFGTICEIGEVWFILLAHVFLV